MATIRNVFTIPAGVSFVDALANGLVAQAGPDPMALADATVLLPTRRACRALAEAFLRRADGAALLLPAMTPIGDIDAEEIALAGADDPALAAALDTPPAIPDLHRRLLLTRLILEKGASEDRPPSPAQAARLAEELARLIDRVQTERLSFDRLATLVPDAYATHWRITLEFLEIVTKNWPAVLADIGCIDPADRRNRLMEAQIEAWRHDPPDHPVIAAGSTGTVPATADLIACVAGLPRGMVVLPGLDTTLDSEARDALEATHPQYGMHRLLDHLGIDADDVDTWQWASVDDRAEARTRLIGAAIRPASVDAGVLAPSDVGLALTSLGRIDCAGGREEAGVVALALREALVTPGKTAALVTADRGLARRVTAEMRRWNVEIDDSAGMPLADTPPGVFLRLTATMVSADLAPTELLATLKHPLAGAGMAVAAFRAQVRALEIAVLRGPRPAPGFDGLAHALDEADRAELVSWLDDLAVMARDFNAALARPTVPLRDMVTAHIGFAEALAAGDGISGADRLWAGETGEALHAFVVELSAAAGTLAPLDGASWPALLEALMAGRVVRPRYGRHPRLAILGPLEARLQHADLVVLGGLNEGSWPPEAETDPWMSRPMRADFGLQPPERRIGLAAHDFAQAFAGPEVLITRATRVEGTPTVASRWLLALDNALARAESRGRLSAGAAQWLSWQAAIDRPAANVPEAAPPCPPVAARPRRLSVTQIETLVRDPYSVYARHVLGLRALDEIDADPGAAERGSVIHDALDRFFRAFPVALPDDAVDRLLAQGRDSFGRALDRPGVKAFWWPRFERIAHWIVEYERSRRTGIATLLTEINGEMVIDAPAGPFKVTAKADRIELRTDGGVAILDYKTGAVPSKKSVELGLSPQLPLEACIASVGGFAGVPAGPVATLAYLELTGGEPPGREISASDDAEALAPLTRDRLERLISSYDEPDRAYPPQLDPEIAPRYSDYDHLARLPTGVGRRGGT